MPEVGFGPSVRYVTLRDPERTAYVIWILSDGPDVHLAVIQEGGSTFKQVALSVDGARGSEG